MAGFRRPLATAGVCLAIVGGAIAVAASGAGSRSGNAASPAMGGEEASIRIGLFAAGGQRSVVTRLSDEGDLCQSLTSGGLPQGGCGGGFAVADSMTSSGGLASIAFFALRGSSSRVVAGTTDAGVKEVIAVDADGGRHRAKVASEPLSVKVIPPSEGLTKEGRRRVAQLPSRIVLRPFAVTLPESRATRGRAPLRFELRYADGRRAVAEGPGRSG